MFVMLSATAQKPAISVAVYSGLAGFKNATADNAIVHRYAYHNDTWWVAYPFGKKPAFSIGAEGNVSVFIKPKFFVSISAGYEQLAVSTKVNYIGTLYILSQYSQSLTLTRATGTETYRTKFLTMLPMFGYRTAIGPINVDVSGGVMFAPALSSRLKGSALAKDSAGADFTVFTDLAAGSPKTDTRQALQLKLGYKKMGLVAGYQWGSKNYLREEDRTSSKLKITTKFLKLGLSYRLTR